MVNNIDKRQKEKAFYLHHLNKVILPFWMNNSMDEKYGGYYTCFNNSGERLVSKDKYIWSQGRMVWALSKLSMMDIYSVEERQAFLKKAAHGARFLMENTLCDNGNCAFLTDRKGNKKRVAGYERYDCSFYADCFVIMGLSMYSQTSQDKKAVMFALSLYDRVVQRVEENDIMTEPYPIPKGYEAHGVYMIMLNTSQEMVKGLRHHHMNQKAMQVNIKADEYKEVILTRFVTKDYLINEFIMTKDRKESNLMLAYVNPGHSIEDVWLLLHQEKDEKNIDTIIKILKKTMEVGWEKQYGGIFAFTSAKENQPMGSIEGIQNEAMTIKIKNDWDYKLWWVHSEALYALLLAYELTADEEILRWYDRVKKYTFDTFPNKDKQIGEWIQIRDRQGNASTKKVALPVKDPYHIIRNLIYIIERL